MARVLLTADRAGKQVGGKNLFDDVTLEVRSGDRVALIGPNGCGKTTFLRIVAGDAAPDHGSVKTAPALRITVFDQHPRFEKEAKVRDVLRAQGGVPPDLAEEQVALEAKLADPGIYETQEGEAVLARYGDLQAAIAKARATAAADPTDSPVFEALGFTESDLEKGVVSLSGGERTRLFLARALAAADPQGLLILDEPTNHLDVEAIEWLEEELIRNGRSLLFVAHDRAFIDNVATRILAFERGGIASYTGGYTDYERARTEDDVRRALAGEREAKEIERQKSIIAELRSRQRFDAQIASRAIRLAKYRATIDRSPDPVLDRVLTTLAFPETFKSSNDVVRIRGLAKKMGERLLFHDLDFDLQKGDRVGLVGPNGAGKTTLLRIMTGKEAKNLGNIDVTPGTRGRFYAQGNDDLDEKNALRRELQLARPGLADDDARGLLGRFGFRAPDSAERKVSSLSGGERARLSLVKTILAPSNLLILDEPTNHLDLEARVALVRALNAYRGTLIVVSHDRWFLDSVVTKIALLAHRKLRLYPGDFSTARVAALMDEMGGTDATTYVVRKSFKDYETGAKHAVGALLKLTDADLNAKRLFRTAIAMGWLAEDE